MAYIAYKYPFNADSDKMSMAAKVFGILAILGIIAGSYMIYSSSNDNTEIIKGQKDLQISQKDLGLAQKDVQISQLKLDLNQRSLSDSISGLKKIINNQQDFLDTIESNAGLSSHQLQIKLDILKKSNDTLIGKETDPLLDILPENNPILKSSWQNSPNMLVVLIDEVINDAVATNLSWKGVIIVLRNGTLINASEIPPDSAKSDIIHFNKGYVLGFSLNPQSGLWDNNKVYFCLKVNYTNKEGQSQKPLIKVYNITNEYDHRFPPIYGEDYDKILTYSKDFDDSF